MKQPMEMRDGGQLTPVPHISRSWALASKFQVSIMKKKKKILQHQLPLTTMPLRGTHSRRPLSRTVGLRFAGSFPNSSSTTAAMSSELNAIASYICHRPPEDVDDKIRGGIRGK